jgi:hypothetical protein
MRRECRLPFPQAAEGKEVSRPPSRTTIFATLLAARGRRWRAAPDEGVSTGSGGKSVTAPRDMGMTATLTNLTTLWLGSRPPRKMGMTATCRLCSQCRRWSRPPREMGMTATGTRQLFAEIDKFPWDLVKMPKMFMPCSTVFVNFLRAERLALAFFAQRPAPASIQPARRAREDAGQSGSVVDSGIGRGLPQSSDG